MTPTISITQTPGADAEKKAVILKAVTEAYVAASDAKAASVWATISEVSGDSWAIAGETLAQRRSNK